MNPPTVFDRLTRAARRPTTLLLTATVLLSAGAASAVPMWLPGPTGAAACRVTATDASLSNDALQYRLGIEDAHLRRQALVNHWAGTTHALDGDLFVLGRRDRTTLGASSFHLEGTVTCAPLAADAAAARLAARGPGQRLRARLASADGTLHVDYTAELRDGGHYVRETFTLRSDADADIARVTLIDLPADDLSIAGTADGSPLVAADRFAAAEYPMSQSLVVAGRATTFLRRALPLRAGVAATYSTVIGAATPGTARRTFAAYLEAERAHPFRTFLHYNSWYDIGYFDRYNETDALKVVARYGDELVTRRHVHMDSFLFDDGWDDTHDLWHFNAGFPQGFTRIHAATAALGAGPGIWLSPWGGYGEPRHERLAAGRAAGFEIDDQGLALSGPRYYELFHQRTLDLVTREGINQFKLDGTGSPDKVTPGSAFDSDFAAAMALIGDLRAARPDLYINLTTGTWPSPFWLLSADSIWRGGEDHSFLGTGSDRARWMTYRDADTYGGIVRQGPLYPLNALMLHGIIYARHARGLERDPAHDFADEVWTYFASGTGLQELYVSPDLLTATDWDTLAEAARFAQEHADILRDSHWIGGDPARGEVYGWASWAPSGAVLALRNPTGQAKTFSIDLSRELDLPPGVPTAFSATTLHGHADLSKAGRAAPPHQTVTLPPYGVEVWSLRPQSRLLT